MKLTWHIVAKDLKRLAYPLVLWALLHVAEFSIGVHIIRGGVLTYESFEKCRLLHYVLYAAQFAVGYVLVAALIHDDPLVGSTAFWPTRPISGIRLLCAKILGCAAIFGALPLLVSLPWWLYCDYGAREALSAGLQTLEAQVAPALVGLMVAVITANLARYLAGTLLLGAAVILLVITLSKDESAFAAAPQLALTGAQSDRRIEWLIALMLLGSSVVIVHQFATRRFYRSLAFLAALVGVTVFAATRRPLDLQHFHDHAQWILPSQDAVEKVDIEFKAARQGMSQLEAGALQPVAWETFDVHNLPAGTTATFTHNEFTWTWPDQKYSLSTNSAASYGYSHQLLPIPVRTPPKEWWDYMRAHTKDDPRFHKSTFEQYRRRWLGPPSSLWTFYEQLPRDVASRMGEPSTCAVTFNGYVSAWSLAPELRMEAGNRWTGKAEGVRIAKVAWNPEHHQMDVVVSEHGPELGWIFNPWPKTAAFWYTAINRRLKETGYSVRGGEAISMRIATVCVEIKGFHFAPPSDWVGDKWIPRDSPDWFADATLARSLETVVGRFQKTVVIDPFRAEPADPDGQD